MIFATIGTQVPFDRFVRMLDEACAGVDEEVVVQSIGRGYEPQHMKKVGLLAPDEFNALFDRARVVVAHAGMGTILSALVARKPLVVVPRRASLGEHRNEHQLATARRFEALGLVHVAEDVEGLRAFLSAPQAVDKVVSDSASRELIGELRRYIDG